MPIAHRCGHRSASTAHLVDVNHGADSYHTKPVSATRPFDIHYRAESAVVQQRDRNSFTHQTSSTHPSSSHQSISAFGQSRVALSALTEKRRIQLNPEPIRRLKSLQPLNPSPYLLIFILSSSDSKKSNNFMPMI
jgi:hypothetical protein